MINQGIVKVLFLFLFFSEMISYEYQLAIASVFQNEARFMKEWIEFHILLGVDHFYLYNDASSDNYLDILKPYIDKGIVELFEKVYSNHSRGQRDIRNDCLKRSSGVAKWVAFIDLDEFLFTVEKDNLIDFLNEFEDFGGVCINWFLFGTSNIKKIPQNKLLIESLTMCDPKGLKHVKSIVRPERVEKFAHPHFATFKEGFLQVNPDKISFNGPFSPYVHFDKARINHYWTRDEHHLNNIKIPRVEKLFTQGHNKFYPEWYPELNAQAKKLTPKIFCLTLNKLINKAEDYTIQKYSEKIRAKILH